MPQTALFEGQLPKIRRSPTAAAPTSLDPQQTNEHATTFTPVEIRRWGLEAIAGGGFEPPPLTPQEEDFRHSGWTSRRVKIRAAMERVQLNGKRRQRFNCCGAGAWVYVTPEGDAAKVHACYCGDRLCVPCGSSKALRISAALAGAMNGVECRFVTLTLAHAQIPLADQLTRLYQCFSNLRRHRTWKDAVTGGAAFCEIKRSTKTNAWHVHLHLIVTGKYISQHALSGAWLVATGDSYIVDVRRIDSDEHAARYVSKYVTKPIDSTVIDCQDKLDEAILALRGRRLCMTFGSWRGIVLEPEKPDERQWKMLDRLDSLMRRATTGDLAAAGILKLLRRENDPAFLPPAVSPPNDDSG